MACSTNNHQLVLFDCDNGRLSLFADHMTLAALIPSNCDYHIFWNDYKVSMFYKLSLIIKQFPQIHLHPSYCEQMTTTPDSSLISFLHEHAPEFAFILLVHGNDRCYTEIFKCITNEYGQHKMVLLAIDKPYYQHVEQIFIRLRTKRIDYSVNDHSPTVQLDERPKLQTSSSLADDLHHYNITQAYLSERAAIKRLTKCKQKSLNIRNNDIYYDKILEFFTEYVIEDEDEENDFDYETFVHQQTQPSKPKIVSLKNLHYCSQCEKIFKSTTDFSQHLIVMHGMSTLPTITAKPSHRNWENHIDEKHAEYYLFSNTESLSFCDSRSMMTKDQAKATQHMNDPNKTFSCWTCSKKFGTTSGRLDHFISKHGKSVQSTPIELSTHASNRIAAVQDQINSATTTINPGKRLFGCWQCTKKLKSDKSLIRHYVHKHASSILATNSDPSRTLQSQIAMVQEQMRTKKDATIATKASLSCSQSSKEFKLTADRDRHYNAEHVQPIISITTKPSYLSHNHREKMQKQTKPAESTNHLISKSLSCSQCAKKFKFTADVKQHFDAKHSQSIFTTTHPASSITDQTALMQKKEKTEEHATDLAHTSFSCSKCPEKFGSSTSYNIHFTANHAESSVFSTTIVSSLLTCKMIALSNQTKSTEHTTNSANISLHCLRCPEIFETPIARDTDINGTYAESNLSTNTKQSNSRDNRSTMAKDQIKIKQHMTNLSKTFSCWKCTKKFESTHQRVSHFINKHATSVRSETIELSTYAGNYIAFVQGQMNGAKSTLNPIRRSFGCWQYTKKLEPDGGLISHFIDKHATCILSIDVDPTNLLENQLMMVQERMKTAENTTISMKVPFSCLQCFKKFECITDLDQHCTAMHGQLNASSTTQSLCFTKKQFEVSEEQNKIVEPVSTSIRLPFDYSQCAVKFESAARRDLHLFTTHIRSSNARDDLKVHTQKQMKVTQHASNLINTFSCWQCTKKLKTANSRMDHFINNHATSIRSRAIELSTHASNHTGVVQDQISGVRTRINTGKRSFGCWQCTQKFKCGQGLIAHFIAKHVSFVLNTNADPSSILENQIAMAQDRMDTTQNTAISTVVLYNYSQCSKKFKSVDARISHCNPKHAESSVSTIIPLSNHPNNETRTVQHQEKVAEHTINSVTLLSYRLQCPEMFEVAASTSIPFNAKQAGSNLSTNIKSSSFVNNQSTMTTGQTNITKRKHHCANAFSCWKCLKKCKTVHSRLNHFLKNHSASFLPAANISSSQLGDQTTPLREQMDSSNVLINPLSKSHNCWECEKKFKSHNDHISHFIEKHARAILFTDADPTSLLKNQITTAQERIKTTKDTTIPTNALFNCSQCLKKFKSANARISHFNAKHAGSTLCIASKLSNHFDKQTTITQKQMTIAEHTAHPIDTSFNDLECSVEFIPTIDCSNHFNPEHVECTSPTTTILSNDIERQTETNLIHISYYCERCQKEFTCAVDHLEHFRTEHIEVKSSMSTLQDFLTDSGIMKCPNAKLPTIVYMSLGTIRKQLCTTPGKTSRCPHEACTSRTTNYRFEDLWWHTVMEHKDAQLKLECCDPTVMYSLEEYKSHLLHLG